MFEFEGLDPTYQLNVDEMEPVDPLPSEDYVMVHAVFYATGFGITILLMNLLASRSMGPYVAPNTIQYVWTLLE